MCNIVFPWYYLQSEGDYQEPSWAIFTSLVINPNPNGLVLRFPTPKRCLVNENLMLAIPIQFVLM
jgi:hypothetical protein